MRFVVWLIRKQQSVQLCATPQVLMHVHKQRMHVNTHSHLGPFCTAGCAMSFLAPRPGVAVRPPLPSGFTLFATADTRALRLNQHTNTHTHTQIWLCYLEQLTSMNGTPEGWGCKKGEGLGGN